MLGPLFAQVAWLRGYDPRQLTRLKLIPSCLAGHVIGLGNSGLSAPDYFCPAIIRETLEASDARWRWMECSISYKFCQLRLIHIRSINKWQKHSIVNLKCPCFLFRYPNLDITSQALFNLHRASTLPLKCVSKDDQNFQSPPGQSRRPVTWCRYLIIPV